MLNFRQFLTEQTGDSWNSLLRTIQGFYNGQSSAEDVAIRVREFMNIDSGGMKAIHGMNPEQFQQSKQAYNSALSQTIQYMNQQGWETPSNAGWQGFNKPNGQQDKINGQTQKRYLSFNSKDIWNVMKHFVKLITLLGNSQTQGKVSVKIPQTFSGFVGQKDQIVVHFYQPADKQAIEAAVQQWLQTANIKEENRQGMNRTTYGTDVNKDSDSMMVGNQVARNLIANKQVLLPMMNNPQQFAQTIQQMINHISMQASHR